MTASSRGLTWLVSLAIAGVACTSDRSAIPVTAVTAVSAPTTSAEPVPTQATATTALAVDECLRSLPFVATYLPDGWSHELQPGNGGEVGIDSDGTIRPFDPPSPDFVHYSGHAVRLGSYINFALGVPEPASSYTALTVLGGAAQFGEIEDGYLVTFSAGTGSCGQYSMLAYGVTPDDVRRVAEGLVPVA